MISKERRSWLSVAFTEIVICCLPLSIFAFIGIRNRDFAQMFSSFSTLMMLFVGYILFKNHQLRDKNQR